MKRIDFAFLLTNRFFAQFTFTIFSFLFSFQRTLAYRTFAITRLEYYNQKTLSTTFLKFFLNFYIFFNFFSKHNQHDSWCVLKTTKILTFGAIFEKNFSENILKFYKIYTINFHYVIKKEACLLLLNVIIFFKKIKRPHYLFQIIFWIYCLFQIKTTLIHFWKSIWIINTCFGTYRFTQRFARFISIVV